MNTEGLNNKSDSENNYNEKPMLPDNQPYTSNPDDNNLPNNTFEQNTTPFPNNFTTPVDSPNHPQQNQTNQYDINQDMEFLYHNSQKQPSKCLNFMLLIMSILMIIFLIYEYFILFSINLAFKNLNLILDDVGILIIAIIFLVSFILSIKGLKGIKSIVRTLLTIFVWFFGALIRVIGISKISNLDDKRKTLFNLLEIRVCILFFSTAISAMNNSKNK